MTATGSHRTIRIVDWIFAGIALVITTYLLFQNLGTPAIRQWDEAIYANNALDMYMTGDPIVMRRNGEPTFYNTKPPLVIWLQMLSLHVFGLTEFAIRFPSAIAGVLTCLLLLAFSIRTLQDIRIGIIAILVLSTTRGFVTHHVTQTGDLDAVLVFWTTFYTLLFLHYLIVQPERHRHLFIWIGIGIAGAFLSKSVAGLMPLIGLVVSAVVTKKAKWIISQWDIWIIAGSVLALCLGYYMLREFLTEGYLYHTWYSEYTRFFYNIMSWHNHPWYYYFWNWERLDFFTPFVYVLPVCLIAGIATQRWRRTSVLLFICILAFIGVLSYPVVKLMWYDAPAYPLLSLVWAVGAITIWDAMRIRMKMQNKLETILFATLVLIVFALPIRDVYLRNEQLRLPVDILEREGYFVREIHRTQPAMKKYKILMIYDQNAHYTQLDFYVNIYNRHKDYQLEVLQDTVRVAPGDILACCQEKYQKWLTQRFITEEITRNEIGCQLVNVIAPRDVAE